MGVNKETNVSVAPKDVEEDNSELESASVPCPTDSNAVPSQPEGDEDDARLYVCAECGESPPLGAVDEEDGQWYCKDCWEKLLDLQGDDLGGEVDAAIVASSDAKDISEFKSASTTRPSD